MMAVKLCNKFSVKTFNSKFSKEYASVSLPISYKQIGFECFVHDKGKENLDRAPFSACANLSLVIADARCIIVTAQSLFFSRISI